MGYMGFGMRKEVYTRKPKTAFKKVKQLYQQEYKKNGLEYKYTSCDNATRLRIRLKIKRQNLKALYLQIFAFTLLTLSLGFMAWHFITFKAVASEVATIDNPTYFKTVIHQLDNEKELKVEYFKFGPKSAETHLKNGLRHQNSESYYESGEQFRSAAYFYDTLIVEVYFYKNGDTIQNFPKITDNNVHHLKLQLPNQEEIAEFDFYDGKILTGSYVEYSK